MSAVVAPIKVAGFHELPCGSYELVADRSGTVRCEKCGSADLLPEAEALAAARGSLGRFDAFAKRFRRSVKAGFRSPRRQE